MKKMMSIFCVLVFLLAACQSSPQPEEAVLAQVEPYNAGDVDAAMALYTDDIVFRINPATPPGSPDQYSGKEELRAWFESLVAMNFEMQIEVVQVYGNTVTTKTQTWVDATRELGVAPLVATEVYTIEDGKIKEWIWNLSDESLAAIQAAMSPPPLNEAIVGLWSWDKGTTWFYFNEDGTYRYDINFDRLSENPADIGRYSIEGNILTFVSGEETWRCEPGSIGIYEITITEEDKLVFVKLEDDCRAGRSAPNMSPQPFARVIQ